MPFIAGANIGFSVWKKVIGTERKQVKFADLNKLLRARKVITS
jgi:hypothetical protein